MPDTFIHASLISVVTVNWYSTKHITHLINNLIEKSTRPGSLRFLIVDNTFGSDSSLAGAISSMHLPESCRFSAPDRIGGTPIEVIEPVKHSKTGSKAHAQALAAAMDHISTPYTLIVDPDIHIFAYGWDQWLIDSLSQNSADAVGAPYPFWKLGKYHDFPSPVFAFFRTASLLSLKPDWTPFADHPIRHIYNLCARQVVRLGFLATRNRIIENSNIRTVGRLLEEFFGVCGPDTGWLVAKEARKQGLRVILFQALTIYDPLIANNTGVDSLRPMAEHFECYALFNRLIVAHKYGTHSFLWKTMRGHDSDFWFKLVDSLEVDSGR